MKKSLVMMIGFLTICGARPAIAAPKAPDAVLQASNVPDSSPIIAWSPAEPKWGDTLVITYDPKAPKAAFALGDEVLAIYYTTPQNKKGLVKLERDGTALRGRIPVDADAGFISGYIIGRQGWDRNARIDIAVAYFLTGGSPERHEQLAPLIDNLLR